MDSDGYGTLFTRAEFTEKAGRAFDNTADCCCVMNGDYSAQPNPTGMHAVYRASDEAVLVRSVGAAVGPIRVCYAIVLGG